MVATTSIVFCACVCLMSIFVYFMATKRLDDTLRLAYLQLIQSLEPYERVLQNARWPAQRYEYLSRMGKENLDKRFHIIEAQMLQLSFGFDYEYFILRSMDGNTRVEIHRGGLISTKSPLFIFNEEDFKNLAVGYFMRPCTISAQQFLCLIDLPNKREFVAQHKRNYSVIALSPTQSLLRIKYVIAHGIGIFPAPTLAVHLGEKQYALGNDADNFLVLTQSQKVDEGFYLHGGYSWSRLLTYIAASSTIITLLALIIGIIAQSYVKRLIKFRLHYALLKNKLEHFDGIQLLIRGVVHDIKSPLAALRSLAGLETNPEKQMLMGHVLKRMQMITQDLEIRRRSFEEREFALLPVNTLLRLTYLEKCKEYEGQINLVFKPNSDECWIRGVFSELLRSLSNIINNAVEASPANSIIFLAWNRRDVDWVEITVRDQGKGIPQHLQTRIFEQGMSFGKKNGTGFGLFHCKETVERLGGKVSLQSTEGVGTTVSVLLPTILKPSWAIERLEMQSIKHAIVVDDEEVFHGIWKKKMALLPIQMHCYSHPTQVPPALLHRKDAITLLDNNFGNDFGLGLRFLEEQSIFRCIVVTAEWAMSDIQHAATRLQVGLCGKELLEHLEVVP